VRYVWPGCAGRRGMGGGHPSVLRQGGGAGSGGAIRRARRRPGRPARAGLGRGHVQPGPCQPKPVTGVAVDARVGRRECGRCRGPLRGGRRGGPCPFHGAPIVFDLDPQVAASVDFRPRDGERAAYLPGSCCAGPRFRRANFRHTRRHGLSSTRGGRPSRGRRGGTRGPSLTCSRDARSRCETRPSGRCGGGGGGVVSRNAVSWCRG